MCAIFGIGLLRGHKITSEILVQDIVRNLFMESMARGRTASGIAYTSTNEIRVIKRNVPASRFINLPEYNIEEDEYVTLSPNSIGKDSKFIRCPPISIMGHCRLKTKGTEFKNVNNHPIVREHVVGVHNGCIMNDDILFNSYSRLINRNGEVDSEIIFALIEHFYKNGTSRDPLHESIQKMSKMVMGSLACSMVHREHPHIVWLFRRDNPCEIAIFKKVGLLIWSSSFGYIEAATSKYIPNLGKYETIDFNSNSGIGIDLYKNRMHRFSISPSNYYASNSSLAY